MRRISAAILAVIFFTAPVRAESPDYQSVIVYNTCRYKVRIMVRHLPPPGVWTSIGWFTIHPQQKTILLADEEGNAVRHDTSLPLYFHADIPNGNYSWPGDKGTPRITFKGRSIVLMKNDTTTITLNCNNKK